MTRMSKQGERRAISPKRPSRPSTKTGPKKDALQCGYKPHENAIQEINRFFPKMK